MEIRHNHAYNFEMRTNLVSDNCPRCRLDANAEDLLIAAEEHLKSYGEKGGPELEEIIDKIRKGTQ